MNPNGKSPLIIPGGGRCLHCTNPQPCWAHSEIILRNKDGSDIRIPNMPALMGMVLNKLTELETRVNRLAAPRVTIE